MWHGIQIKTDRLVRVIYSNQAVSAVSAPLNNSFRANVFHWEHGTQWIIAIYCIGTNYKSNSAVVESIIQLF